MTFFESNHSNPVGVNGIILETLLSEQIVQIPTYGEETPVQFGVRITNQTSLSYRFDLPFVLPEILNHNGKEMQRDLAKNATKKVKNSDIPIIMPGDNLEFLMEAKFSWYSRNCLRLSGYAIYGGVWVFWNFKSGKYQIRLSYENQLEQKKMMTLNEGMTEIDGFWTGKIMTPFAAMHLR